MNSSSAHIASQGLGHDKSLPAPFAAIGQKLPEGASFTLECVEPELALVQSLLPLRRGFLHQDHKR
jgi:hypothetical protein